MAVKKTGLLALYFGGTKVAHLVNAKFTLQKALNDVTTKDSNGWTERTGGIRSATFSGDGVLHDADEAALQAAYNNDETLALMFTDDETGNSSYDCTVIVDNLDLSSDGAKGVPGFSISGASNGVVSFNTVA